MTSERRTVILMIVLIVVACGGYAYWWLQKHHLVDKEFRENPSKEVRENPFYAAQLFLEQKGYQVELSNGLNRFQALPPSDDMIVGESLGRRLPEQRIDEMLDWVSEGGQLLTSVQRSWSEDNPGAGDKLLSKLGVTLWAHEDEDVELSEDEEKPYFDVVSATLSSGETIKAEFEYGLSLYDYDSDRETFYLSSEGSDHLLLIPHGSGWIMLATDLTFIKNPRHNRYWNSEESKPYINHRDHAFLLNWLAESNEKIWLVRGVDAEPLTTLLWRHAQHAVIALLCLLAIWLWWLYDRFGPLRGSTIPERRNILEHLLMSAIYAWRQDRAQQLFADTRKDIELLVRRKHPQIATLQPADRIRKLAEHCAMPPEQVDRALHNEWRGEREFIELTYLLQQIRKKL